MYQTLIVRYGEISLKGKNRYKFEDSLVRNIRYALHELAHGRIRKAFGRIYVDIQHDNWGTIVQRLSTVFGITSISPVLHCSLTMEAIEQSTLTLMEQSQGKTFKVSTKRANKRFPIDSMTVSRELGAHVLNHFPQLTVDVHHPDINLQIELRDNGAYLFNSTIPGSGGMPVGSSNKGLLLLSGGIDSPVAGYLTMKRGVTLEGLHFYSYPFTNERSKDKVIELTRILAGYAAQGKLKLWVAYFTEIQKALEKNPYSGLKITLMRRMMLRIAHTLAEREGALALITGDSLGQVASQTMESISTINAVTNMPIFRPLISMDKQEIIDIARRIQTYETSILPHEDCCTVFVPKNPATRPRLEQALEAESHLDIPGLVEEAISRTESLIVSHKIDFL